MVEAVEGLGRIDEKKVVLLLFVEFVKYISVNSMILSSPLRPRTKPFCLGSMMASSAGMMQSAMTAAVIRLEVLLRVIGRVRSIVELPSLGKIHKPP